MATLQIYRIRYGRQSSSSRRSVVSYGKQPSESYQPQQLCATCAACPTCGPSRNSYLQSQTYVDQLQRQQQAEMAAYQAKQEKMRQMYEHQERG